MMNREITYKAGLFCFSIFLSIPAFAVEKGLMPDQDSSAIEFKKLPKDIQTFLIRQDSCFTITEQIQVADDTPEDAEHVNYLQSLMKQYNCKDLRCDHNKLLQKYKKSAYLKATIQNYNSYVWHSEFSYAQSDAEAGNFYTPCSKTTH